MALPNAYRQYKQQSVYTMTPEELLLLLFDEWIKRMHQGILALKKKDLTSAHNALIRCQDIVRYLNLTLKDEYAVAKEIGQLYEYFLQCLMMANARKNPQLVEEILPMVEELRDTWRQACKINRQR